MIYEVLCDTRSIKADYEKDLLNFIANITNQAHLEIMKNICPGQYERDLENVFMTHLRDNYYTRLWAYPCIGGCGHNSATLHYDINDCVIKDGDLFLADMGIRFCNYVSDVTITIPANGKFTERQKMIYNIVLKANRSSMQMIEPNQTTFADICKRSSMEILSGLQEIGLIHPGPSIQELFDAGLHQIFMPHSLGHLVGLDVHDVGFRVSYKKERILLEGQFITIEPGIYFIPFVLDRAFSDPNKSKYLNVDEIKTNYYNFGGVRIEDDVYITGDKVINFQEGLPRTAEAIEDYMAKNNVHLLKKKNLK